jgi:hypothetical protein
MIYDLVFGPPASMGMTEVTMTIPGTPSAHSEAAATACGVKLRAGCRHHMRIAFDGGASRRTHRFKTLPIDFCW